MRPSFILLLIVTMLTCPLRCISCEAIAAVGDDAPVASCSCCDTETCPTSDAPAPCEDGCDCQNCFCDGAVLENGPESLDAALELTQWVFLTVDLDQASGSAFLVSDPNQLPLHARFACGRDARIGLQSLLI